MPELWLAAIAIIAGFIGLVWSADRFVGGSAAIASNLGVSRLIIGLTIVSLGTSAPEIVVSLSASIEGAGDLAIGNALGSNLANIGLVLAVTALIAPMPIQRHLITQEIPVLLVITLLAGIVLFDAYLSGFEGWLLIGVIPVLMLLMIYTKKKHPSPEEEDSEIPSLKMFAATLWFVFGLAALIVSSEILVWGAQIVATAFGVSPLIIGLTVIAVGTSLPELAASVMSAIKGHHDMALGNIIGSNIFNILAVMSLPGVIAPPNMGAEVFSRDFLAMGGITLLLALVVVIDYYFRNRNTNTQMALLGRKIGVLLLACYIGYYFILFS